MQREHCEHCVANHESIDKNFYFVRTNAQWRSGEVE